MISHANRRLLKSLLLLGSVVEARDPFTGGHLWRMSQICKLLADRLGASRRVAVEATVGGWLHDVGKIATPDSILLKRGKLDDDEMGVMRRHPVAGAALLRGHPLGRLARRAVVEHHERLDGSSYPAGLRGDEIGAAARIVAAGDSFDAMTSVRPYRKPIPVNEAIGRLRPLVDRQYDSAVFAALETLASEGALSSIVGHSEHGTLLVLCPHCGPTIAVSPTAAAGAPVQCAACLGAFTLAAAVGGGWRAEPAPPEASEEVPYAPPPVESVLDAVSPPDL